VFVMKSLYLVNYGSIHEVTNQRGNFNYLSDEEIVGIVKPLVFEVRRVIKNDRISIFSSDGRKHKQAAGIVGKMLGIKPIFRNIMNNIDENDVNSIINMLPQRSNQIVLLGVNKIETILDYFSQRDNSLISEVENIASDKQFCPYEIWKMNITNKNLKACR